MGAFTYDIFINLWEFPKADSVGGVGAMLTSEKKLDQKQKFETLNNITHAIIKLMSKYLIKIK